MAKIPDSARRPPADVRATSAPMLFASARAWEKWLAQNHAKSLGVWLKIAKQGGGTESVSYAEALEAALTFGWIDGRKDKLDDSFWLQKFTPRARKSRWSATNCASATRLIAEGRMRPPGLRAIEDAKADGRWEGAYAPQSRATVPPDLERALDADPAARAFFAALDGHNRYAILYRVQEAKKPETRASRIAKFVTMLANGETIHPKASGPTKR